MDKPPGSLDLSVPVPKLFAVFGVCDPLNIWTSYSVILQSGTKGNSKVSLLFLTFNTGMYASDKKYWKMIHNSTVKLTGYLQPS